jgi:acyl-CoA reductase-like NAD-dependent aldehyde dehydrogenase
MNVHRRGHWIGGEECPGRAEWETPADGELHTWPRARLADLERALALAAEPEARSWRRTTPELRAERLAGALRELGGGAAWRAKSCACLGLSADELEPQTAGLDATEDGGAWFPRPAATTAEAGPAVHLGHWSEGLGVAAARCLARLAAGQPVIYLGDLEQPWTGHALGSALARAGLPPGVFAILHGATPELGAAWERSPAETAPARIQGRIEGAPSGWARRLPAEGARVERWQRTWAAVDEGEDPRRAAQSVVRAAFGRAAALGGQAHGRIGVVLVPERNFSAFTSALLDALERCDGEVRPVPPITRAVERAQLDISRRALQAGECLIAGGGRGSDGRLEWRPTVFTNAEPGLDAVRDPRPVPLLHLLRMPRGGSPDRLGAALGSRSQRPLG